MVERLAQLGEHVGDALVRADRILLAGDTRKRLLQPPHPFVERRVVDTGQGVCAMKLAHHASHRDR